MDNWEKSFVSLTISGDSINFKAIERNIPLKQIHNKKGTKLKSFISVEVDNVIFNDFNLVPDSSIDDQISIILNTMEPYKNYIKELSKQYNIRLRIYIQSTMAQMFFYISNEIIQRISEFNMSIETSIFSEGLCIDDR